MAKFKDIEAELLRDNQRWFDLYKQSSGSMGGVVVLFYPFFLFEKKRKIRSFFLFFFCVSV